ncbi:WAT1-related protein At1g68170-like [Camellia sinensis]|uniref:WAT1-related protein At1g68170-like n=1 Tax=Camellia sinensis TaxID=4442 RepID=UPI0010369229|nr:WAT1-related protein At1g68170-like [Camellia sinensis]
MMVVVQAALAGNSIFYKLASSIGMSMRVLIAYRFVIAVAFIVPLALLLERGSMAQNLYAEGFVLTSATFAAALYNLIPACTFILAVFFRMERLGLGTTIGKMKVAGTLMCIGGAMLLIFYKGVELNISSTNVDLLHYKGGHVATLHPHDSNNVVGALLVVSCCVSVAIGLIVQAKMIQDYPCVYSSTALMMTMAAIQAIGFALCMDRDWSKWKLGWNLRLLTVSYSGIVASGVTFTVMAWCVQIRGPLFVSIFSPVMLVLVAIAGLLLLDEKLHLGSVLGAGVIVCGLYIVLKGKSKELKRITQLMPSKSSKESEHIDIIVTSLTENNNGSSDNITVVEEEEEEEVSSEVEGVFNLDQMSSHEIVAI